MEHQYDKTITACFVGYIVQAVVNNFVPLLFIFGAIYYNFSTYHKAHQNPQFK